ncbi:hypothetical protein C810_02432 [Lachnospiraceae bacterium A2]|nr:hypothetical protein C810_02432 [Lachnospiraceae bacterium A2]
MPPTSQFFQVPASGEFEKLEPVREHRQCLLFLFGKGFIFPAFREKLGNFFSNAPIEGALLYLQLTSETAEKGGEKVLDHAFQRRREIERMLLSGKRLTVSELMGRYCVGRKSISRDFEVIGEELPVISKKGYNGGYFLMDGVGKNQNTLSHEQLECLEKLAVGCTGKDRETVLSIIHEFGPYCERNT